MRIIAVANQKGGCGKTTTSINLAACLAFLQKKTLLVDLDPQGHSTCGLGIHVDKQSYTIYDLLSRGIGTRRPEISQVLAEVNPFLSLIPSHVVLGAVEEQLANLPDREKRLKQELDRVFKEKTDFDFVIIDCPPNIGVLTFNALEAADEILIPVEPSFFSLHGLAKMSETVNLVNQRRDRPIAVHALLVLFDSRTCFAKEVYEDVKAHFQERLFRTIIHESVALKEAAGAGQSIVQYDPESAAFRDYFNLAVEYLGREWDRLLPEHELGWSNVLGDRYGPRRVSGGILFQAVSRNARGVEIAGDFNNWVPEPLVRRDGEGLWQKVIPILSGNFRYKFIVDGEWQLDPCQPAQKQNAFGSFDSYMEVI